MKIAYADPPYIGQAKKHYRNDPICAEVDHAELIHRMSKDFDAWALSCSSPSLREILPMCPQKSRVMAWIKPFCSFKPGVGVAYSWEPVIVYGARKRTKSQPTVRDYISCNITLNRGVHGAKPLEFCLWLLSVLNVLPEDEFHDLFPGSGIMADALRIHFNQGSIFNEP